MGWFNLPPSLGPLRRVARTLYQNLPPLNFVTVHYIYFIGTCLLSALIFWGASTPPRTVSFTDSLFLTVSAMTLAGLNTINLSTLNTFQQFMLFMLIILGSAIFVSAFVVQIRKKAFEKRFKSVIEKQRRKREHRKSLWGSLSLVSRFLKGFARSDNRTSVPGSIIEDSGNLAIDVSRPTEEEPRGRTRTIRHEGENGNSIHLDPDESDIDGSGPPERRHNRFLSMQGVGAHSNATARVRFGSRPSLPDLTPSLAPHSFGERARTYLPFPSSGYISRNSQFHHLTNAEREKLGGCEYRAIQFLADRKSVV